MKKCVFSLFAISLLCISLHATTHTITSNSGGDGSGTFRDKFKNAGNTDIIVFNIDGNDTISLDGALSRTKGNTKITVEGINQATGNPIVLKAKSGNSIFRSSSGTDRDNINVTFNNLVFLNASNSSHGGAFSLGHSTHEVLASFIFSECVFENCSSSARGGAIGVNKNVSLQVENCTFYGNSAGTSGGAISSVSTTSVINIKNCTFYDNSTDNTGGAIYINSDNPSVITNCTFYNNTANSGGAMFVNSITPDSLINCTFVNNKVGSTEEGNGALYADTINVEEPINNTVLINCIVSGTTETSLGNAVTDVYGKKIMLKNCIVQTTDESVSTGYITNPVTYASSVFPSGTPELKDNGGFTQTIAISKTGAAFQTGTTEDNIPETDQRGIARNVTPCIGAYEAEVLTGQQSPGQTITVAVNNREISFISGKSGLATIYNLAGEILFEKYSSGNITYTAPYTGIYIVRFIEGGNIFKRKIVIK
ncbi:MAG: choice-of-anchor Q domain-containing protein [Paludibacter sp.]|nr:choice-of-anchor Q domain-containing protein [Paludibacter sp.]